VKRLLIFRHAKAGPHDEKHDQERALIQRGRDDAARMGRAMYERGYVPDLVLCSSAKRTVETWQHAAPELQAKSDVRFLDALYDAPEKSVLQTVRSVNSGAPVILYIGHNPGLENLARMLARKPAEPAEKRRAAAMQDKFPTSAVAVVDFDVDAWSAIAPDMGALVDFITPADLKKANTA
jgi:phosphohistidine phosphatase